MDFIKGFDLFDGSGSDNVVIQGCHSCHGDMTTGAIMSICGSIATNKQNGKWVV